MQHTQVDCVHEKQERVLLVVKAILILLPYKPATYIQAEQSVINQTCLVLNIEQTASCTTEVVVSSIKTARGHVLTGHAQHSASHRHSSWELTLPLCFKSCRSLEGEEQGDWRVKRPWAGLGGWVVDGNGQWKEKGSRKQGK